MEKQKRKKRKDISKDTRSIIATKETERKDAEEK